MLRSFCLLFLLTILAQTLDLEFAYDSCMKDPTCRKEFGQHHTPNPEVFKSMTRDMLKEIPPEIEGYCKDRDEGCLSLFTRMYLLSKRREVEPVCDMWHEPILDKEGHRIECACRSGRQCVDMAHQSAFLVPVAVLALIFIVSLYVYYIYRIRKATAGSQGQKFREK